MKRQDCIVAVSEIDANRALDSHALLLKPQPPPMRCEYESIIARARAALVAVIEYRQGRKPHPFFLAIEIDNAMRAAQNARLLTMGTLLDFNDEAHRLEAYVKQLQHELAILRSNELDGYAQAQKAVEDASLSARASVDAER